MSPTNNTLIDDNPHKIRTPQEVAKRVIVLIGVFQAATGRDKATITQILKENDLWSNISELEKKFLETSDDDSKFVAMQYSWRAEAAYILLWTLKKVNLQEIPKNESNLDEIKDLLKEDDFFKKIDINKAQLRSINEIYILLDKVNKINWEIRDAHINNKPSPNDYHPSILYEWHYALNWLTQLDLNWDYIPTDT